MLPVTFIIASLLSLVVLPIVVSNRHHPHLRVMAEESERKALALFLGMERLLSDQALKQGRLGDALAHTGDEGRSTLR